MSADQTQQAAVATSPEGDLTVVRISDVRRLRHHGVPYGTPVPRWHGGKDDPRYAQVGVRIVIAFILDMLIHLGGAVLLFYLVKVKQVPALHPLLDLIGLWAILAFIGLSIVDRILVQWLAWTTIGKALVGVCTIRTDTGGRPTLWKLTKQYLVGILGVLSVY